MVRRLLDSLRSRVARLALLRDRDVEEVHRANLPVVGVEGLQVRQGLCDHLVEDQEVGGRVVDEKDGGYVCLTVGGGRILEVDLAEQVLVRAWATCA